MAGSLCCVLGKDTKYKWVPANCQENLTKCFDGLASHSGGVPILLVTSRYGNKDKLWLCAPLGLCVDFTYSSKTMGKSAKQFKGHSLNVLKFVCRPHAKNEKDFPAKEKAA